MIEHLQRLEADSYILMLKTHNFHWNVEGPYFQQLHLLFEGQYTELFAAVDEVAERLRAVNEKALVRYKDFQERSKIKDSSETDYRKMIKELVQSNEEVVKTAQSLVKLAQKAGDEATADLAIKRIQIHQKNAWMLRSHLKE